ncbi:MAG: hypothetical protein OEM02_16945, partial [Desulfobulbaceae bacterium]|nr:hypothetical protein [Desulfobulbaceae bacterium]
VAMEAARDTAIHEKSTRERRRPEKPVSDPLCDGVRKFIVPLNLTDAYGPTFTIVECRSLHDIIRYAHEKAVLAMFEAGDITLEKGGASIHVVETMVPFHVNIIDLGGGLARGEKRRFVPPAAVLSTPFIALWEGIATPGLRWGPPPGAVNIGSVMSKYLIDQRSPRPLGMPNYAIISRDYLNLNARMDFHFVMIDGLCGLTSRSNYVRFRFKGGGTSKGQCKRRATLIASILEGEGFFTDVRGDLVNGTIQGVTAEHLTEKLVVLGRLLGFTRLLDAAMQSDEIVEEMVLAFQEGDYALSRFEDQ